MTTLELRLGQIVDKPATRKKGFEGARSLAAKLSTAIVDLVIVDFRGIEFVSTSFVDEFTRQCHQIKLSRGIDFQYRVDTELVRRKFARASAYRKIPILVLWGEESNPRIIEPFTNEQAEIVEEGTIPEDLRPDQ